MPMDMKPRGSDLFDKLDREDEQESRELEVTKNPTLESLLKGFENYLNSISSPYYSEKYEIASRCLTSEPISARDVFEFSIRLARYENRDDMSYSVVPYLNQIIYRCRDDDVTICTNGLHCLLNNIGRDNDGKNIIVIGDAGSLVGGEMRNGAIRIGGRIEGVPGQYMSGGEIYIDGGKAFRLPKSARGGDIYYKGKLKMRDGGRVR